MQKDAWLAKIPLRVRQILHPHYTLMCVPLFNAYSSLDLTESKACASPYRRHVDSNPCFCYSPRIRLHSVMEQNTTHVQIHTCTKVRTYTHTCTYTCVYSSHTHTHPHPHTHTHTHTYNMHNSLLLHRYTTPPSLRVTAAEQRVTPDSALPWCELVDKISSVRGIPL